MQVRINNEMACQIHQRQQDVCENHGRYLDLKLFPKLAKELPEALAWPALGSFIESINETHTFLTTGCTASGKTSGGHEAPFVDVAFDDPRLRTTPDAQDMLRDNLMSLNGDSAGGDLIVELVSAEATLPNGEPYLATRLWFIGEREQSEQAFPRIIDLLKEQRVVDYVRGIHHSRYVPGSSQVGCMRAAIVAVAVAFAAGWLLGRWLYLK